MGYCRLIGALSVVIPMTLFATIANTSAPPKTSTLPESQNNSDNKQSLNITKNPVESKKNPQDLEVAKPLVNKVNYEVFLLTAQSYELLNNSSEALVFYNRALNYAQTNDEIETIRSKIEKVKQLPVNGTLNEEPIIQSARINIAKKYIDENKGQEALNAIKPLLTQSPNFEVFIITAQAYAEMDNPSVAMEYFNKALLLARSDVEIQIAKSGIDKMSKWLSEYNKALIVEQSDVDVTLVKKYINENNGIKALEELRPLLSKPQVPFEVLILAAQAHAELNEPALALFYYEKAELLADSEIKRQITNSGIQKMKTWLAQAKVSKSATPKQDPKLDLAIKYIDTNQGKKALEILKPLLKSQQNFKIFRLAAQSYAEINEPSLSLSYYKKALSSAKTADEQKIASEGIKKMNNWLAKERKTAKPALSPLQIKLNLVREYISKDQGDKALELLQPLLLDKPNYQVFMLTALSYAQTNKPRLALNYYRNALPLATTPKDRVATLLGIGKMHFWMGQYFRAERAYAEIFKYPTNSREFDLALAGKVKSLAYADRPIRAFKSIPPDLIYETPELVVAAIQSSLWSDWADISKQISLDYEPIIAKIPPESALGKDISDAFWQINQATWPNAITPGYFYSIDSDDYQISRGSFNYSHYWSQIFQSEAGFIDTVYTQPLSKQPASIQSLSKLVSKTVYFGETIRPTRQLILSGRIAPSDYELWRPFLWSSQLTYRPSDYVSFLVQGFHEAVEALPALSQHITATQVHGNINLAPLPYVKVRGVLNNIRFSDTNNRDGYFVSVTTLLSTELGLSFILQEKAFRSKFVSPYYFSPNKYVLDTAILRFGRRYATRWHYYIDGGLGRQFVGVDNVDSRPSRTWQWGLGLNGPITDRVILNLYYLMTTQAANFTNSSVYKYQAGAVELKFLI